MLNTMVSKSEKRIMEIATARRLPVRRIIQRDYSMLEDLGEGEFGSVRVCRSKATGSEYACKTILKNNFHACENRVRGEIDIMYHLSRYNHPGVVSLHAVYEDYYSFHIVMELVTGGDLSDWINREFPCSETESACKFKQLMEAIKHCHDNGVIHRDIKPDNVLVTKEGVLKLADFGSATRFSKGKRFSSVDGSANYMAPEVLAENYTEKADVWSAGIILYVMLVGRLPFGRDDEDEELMFEAVENQELSFDSEEWESVSAPARDLIRGILDKDASARLSAQEVLAHPWIMLHTSQRRSYQKVVPKRNHSRLEVPI